MKMSMGWTWALLATGAALVVAGGTLYRGGAPGESVAAVAESESLPTPNPDLPVVTVWKSPTCGCCAQWVTHMREAGFQVDVEDMVDVTPKKVEHGVLPPLQSCHTALVDGYALEGHVPADDVKRMLAERPQAVGLAVPGMPVGAPGMEVGDMRDRYDVLAFDREGRTTVWSSHP